MRQRCLNTNDSHYPRYGGRGITICSEWDDYEVFLSDMGKCPSGMSLDRINNDGNYSPDNCRWATYSVQNANRALIGKHISKKGNQFILQISIKPFTRFVKGYPNLETAENARADCLFEREIYKRLS